MQLALWRQNGATGQDLVKSPESSTSGTARRYRSQSHQYAENGASSEPPPKS